MNNIHNEQKARRALEAHIKETKALKFIVWIAVVLISVLVMIVPPMVQAEEFDVKSFLDNVHVRVGVAYKVEETDIWFKGEQMNKATTARLGAWYRFNDVFAKGDSLDFGVDHHSQYFERARKEYS